MDIKLSNQEKIKHFCERICSVSNEIVDKKEPCECTFKLYFDKEGVLNQTPTEIIQKKFLI